MGASDWNYHVTWEPDLQAALNKLCREQFTVGDYYRCWEELFGSVDFFEFKLAELEDDDFDDENTPGWTESIEAVRNNGLPTTLEALTALSSAEGMHSILDCPKVASEPEFGAVAPFTSDEIVEIFGDAKPTTEKVLVEITAIDLPRRMERWEGRYVIGYDLNGMPQTIHFVGFSGD